MSEKGKLYSVVFLRAKRLPIETYLIEVEAKSPESILFWFVNVREYDDHFIACIIEGPAVNVHQTNGLQPTVRGAQDALLLL